MRHKTKTDKFQFTIGVTEGYFHNNENANIDFIKLVDKCARETENIFGIYISFNIVPTITLYKSEWGCPDGGEKTYTLSAIRNPMFNDNSYMWKLCCTNVAIRLKMALNQTTVTGEFSEVDIEYWK